MYEIDATPMSQPFFECWKAAGVHLNRQVDSGIRFWLRGHPYPPYLEHLSFRLGNQLFFVRIIDADGRIEGPGTMAGLRSVARESRGHAVILPMRRHVRNGWVAERPGWGLIDAESGAPINPPALVTEAKIEITDREVHDMAVQIVRDHIAGEGFELMSWQSNPEVNPSIWFVGKSGGPEWVVVRAVRYPASNAPRPDNWAAIARQSSRMSPIGHFASVALASTDQPFKTDRETPVPLWRGYAMHVSFEGLEAG